jgi:hypothetical protein
MDLIDLNLRTQMNADKSGIKTDGSGEGVKTVYEYIEFEVMAEKPRTTVWVCLNRHHGEVLGQVYWHGPWRQYCFFPGEAVFSGGCLADIADFLKQVNEMQKVKQHEKE